jgi:hypothetical protein
MNSVSIIVMNAIFKIVSRKLNDWENHRTNTEYDDMLVAKVCVCVCERERERERVSMMAC